MAFVTKTWKDRLVEVSGRRKLKNVSTNEEIIYDVSRSEGTIMQVGDQFSAENMNNLEQRIKTEFDSVNSSLGGLKFGIDGDGNYGYYGADGSLVPFSSFHYHTEKLLTKEGTTYSIDCGFDVKFAFTKNRDHVINSIYSDGTISNYSSTPCNIASVEESIVNILGKPGNLNTNQRTITLYALG